MRQTQQTPEPPPGTPSQGNWIVSALEEDGGPALAPSEDEDMAPAEESPAAADSNLEQISTVLDSTASLRTTRQADGTVVHQPVPVNRRPGKRPIILREIVQKPAEPQPEPTPAPSQLAQTPPSPAAPAPPQAQPQDPRMLRLCLIIHQKVILVDASRPNVAMGRDESNDVIIGVGTASRRHAEVVLKDGQFYLVDHSWNGTYLYDEHGHETLVHNDEVPVTRSGVICPGCPGDVDGVEAIRFVLAS